MKHQLALSILVIAIISVGVGSLFGNSIINEALDPQSTQNTETDAPQLEVKPASGDPIPLTDFTLQGTATSQQQAEGGLQTPQSSDELQPNAKTDIFSDDL